MKKGLFLLFFLLPGLFAGAQMMSNFFYAKGVRDLSYCAHISNPYLKGDYDVEPDYVLINIESYDSLFDRTIYTRVKIGKGIGGLYFNSLQSLSDNDIVSPFAAFGLASAVLIRLAREISPADYDAMKQRMIDYFNIDPEKWNGATWALFALNLDYYNYILSQ